MTVPGMGVSSHTDTPSGLAHYIDFNTHTVKKYHATTGVKIGLQKISFLLVLHHSDAVRDTSERERDSQPFLTHVHKEAHTKDFGSLRSNKNIHHTV